MKKKYYPPLCEDLGKIKHLCLLASLSLEGNVDEIIDGGDGEYVDLDPSLYS